MKEISLDLLSGKVVQSIEILDGLGGYDVLHIEFDDKTYLECYALFDSDLIVNSYDREEE